MTKHSECLLDEVPSSTTQRLRLFSLLLLPSLLSSPRPLLYDRPADIWYSKAERTKKKEPKKRTACSSRCIQRPKYPEQTACMVTHIYPVHVYTPPGPSKDFILPTDVASRQTSEQGPRPGVRTRSVGFHIGREGETEHAANGMQNSREAGHATLVTLPRKGRLLCACLSIFSSTRLRHLTSPAACDQGRRCCAVLPACCLLAMWMLVLTSSLVFLALLTFVRLLTTPIVSFSLLCGQNGVLPWTVSFWFSFVFPFQVIPSIVTHMMLGRSPLISRLVF